MATQVRTLLLTTTFVIFLACVANAQTYVNNSIGIEFDIPDHWISDIQGQSVVFSGAKDSDEWNVTISLQYVPAGSSNIDNVIADLRAQWQKNAGYRELQMRKLTIHNYQASNIEIEYTPAGTPAKYRQDQLVFKKDGHFYLLGFIAPAAKYETYHPAMDKTVRSLKLASKGPSQGISVSKSGPAPDEIKIVAGNLQEIIGSVQLFRELCATAGMAGWEKYASPAALEKIRQINGSIWNKLNPDDVWQYVFSASSTMINKLESGIPVIGFYHPWSDTWVVTTWLLKTTPIIADVELLTGNWIRERGEPPFQFMPKWLTKGGFPAEDLANSFSESMKSFENAAYSPAGWRSAIRVDSNRELLLSYNYPAYAGNLLLTWNVAMAFYDEESTSPEIPSIRSAVQKFITSGTKGEVSGVLDKTRGTTPLTKQQLAVLAPEDFEAFTTLYWRSDAKYSVAFLSFAGNPELLLSLFFVNEWAGLQLDRVDIVDLREVLQVAR